MRINNKDILAYLLNRQLVIKVRLLGWQQRTARPDLPFWGDEKLLLSKITALMGPVLVMQWLQVISGRKIWIDIKKREKQKKIDCSI